MANEKIKAKKLFIQGVKPREISEKLNISYSTLRSWISREKWKDEKLDNKNDVATKNKVLQQNKKDVATKNKASPKKTRSKRVPALDNNKLAVKHGAYERIMYSTMTEEEIDLISDANRYDELMELEREKDILTVREFKYMRLINTLRNSDKDLIVVGADRRATETFHKGTIDTLDFKEEAKEINTRTVYAFELINKYESELTRIQKQRAKVISEIAKIKHERELLDIAKEKLELEKLKVQTSETTEDRLEKLIDGIRGIMVDEE
ncbi:terminase gpP N-terminus-related DNA-binding protein [Peptostreptococcus anaerobius]|uniref:terminase gpP N-terminus-related DNA-binding protein n=1 Tax=Peptostreptococcus anaerobius TaxID=1261 RepID=UPI00290051FD|nr:helix-turn-helix domain-containing protein [Peptostreptococcus anaerobius]MDU1599130.1 helix-turn-helix domain-containing protein [Peptostreptococcus anaerobius]MDU1663937.1 helix-turn-helix domain-containing protein [Peptoniphilus harei]MDU1682215.1 helix-turn-helix domain-containing protein [Peptostreptococcus anaerobius]